MVLFFTDVFSERKILAFSVTWIILNSVNKKNKKRVLDNRKKKNDEKFKDFSVVQFTRIEVLNWTVFSWVLFFLFGIAQKESLESFQLCLKVFFW